MEEVDRIIIHSLRDIGCVIEYEVETLDQFTTEIVVDAAVRCLEIIMPETEIPRTLPFNVASRFHVGTSIAEACKDIGYNGDVGYQTFLYSNAVEVRRVFMFLIEKLPREKDKDSYEPDDPLSNLKSAIGNEIKKRLAIRSPLLDISSTPFESVNLETGIIGPGIKVKGNPKDWREYVINDLPFLTEQTTYQKLLPSIITLNAKGLCKIPGLKSKEVTPSPSVNDLSSDSAAKSEVESTRLSLNETLFFSKVVKNPDNISEVERTEIVDGLPVNDLSLNENTNNSSKSEETVEYFRENIEKLQAKIRETYEIIEKVAEDCKREAQIASERSNELAIHDKALSLLPETEKNMEELKQAISTLSDRILSLAGKWESYRKPLLEKYMSARSKIANRENRNYEEQEKIEQLKGKIDVLNKQLVAKRGIISQLEEEYDKLPKNINRSAYTRRIMEIIGNISKQKDQIEKILSDTKELQKDINSLNGRLERLFAVTEETIFRKAKKDEFSKRSYKLLLTLHSDCASIGSLVLEIGTITREITDLKEQIEFESRKNTTANLERIAADLEQMRAESKSLKTQMNKNQSSTSATSHPLQ